MNTSISSRTAYQLYWLGRYLQRAETTLREMIRSYDYVIDRDFDDGKKVYAKLGVDLTYTNAKDFLYQGVYGTHQAALKNLFKMARENAIETRNLLDVRGFSTLNTIYNRLKEGINKPICPAFLESALDDVRLILGILFSELYRPKAYLFIRLGQQIERMDLMLRLFDGFEMIILDLEGMNAIAKRLNSDFVPLVISHSDTTRALDELNNVINKVIVNEI
jgi:uncharacterized alpha-E superfamily protein